MSRLHFIVLACFVSTIFCYKWHVVLEFSDSTPPPLGNTIQSFWVDDRDAGAPKVKLMSVNETDSSTFSYIILENQMYEVYQNLTTTKCVSFGRLSQQEADMLAIVVASQHFSYSVGRVFQDEVCEQFYTSFKNISTSMCFSKRTGYPVSVSVHIPGQTWTAKMSQFTTYTEIADSVFNLPQNCNPAPTANELQF